jgi:hypothetical protein
MTLLKSFQQCQWHHWNFRHDSHSNFCCVIDTADMISEVSMTPRKWLWHLGIISAVSLTLLKRCQWCQGHRWNSLSGVSDTVEIYLTPLNSQNDFASPYLLLKRTPSKNISWVIFPTLCKYFKQKNLFCVTFLPKLQYIPLACFTIFRPSVQSYYVLNSLLLM